MIFQEIYIPIVSAYNWQGFQPQQMRDVQDTYYQRHHKFDVSYQQFRGSADYEYVLRLRNKSHEVIKQWSFNQKYYPSASKYNYMYDVYFDLEQDCGQYYLDIFNETLETICANTHPFYIVEDVEKWLSFEGFNVTDKDGWIYTEEEGKFIQTDASVGAGVLDISVNNIRLTIENVGDADSAKLLDKDGVLIQNQVVSSTTIEFTSFEPNEEYRVLVYDADGNLLSYTNWFEVRIILGNYTMAAQNRVRMRFESNIRQDQTKETSTFNSFTDQDFDKRTTSSDENTLEIITFGSRGVPNWVARKINRLLGLTNFSIQGESYAKINDLGQDDERELLEYGFTIPRYEVQKSEHQEFESTVIGAILTNENYSPLANENDKIETL